MSEPHKFKKLGALTCFIFILATLAFIWGNSFQSAEESGALSGSVLDKIKPVLEFFIGAGNATDHLVRKLAHFTEFGVLGIELALLFNFIGRVRIQNIVNCAFFGMAVALVDETIQIFTGRGSQVQDVWLDFGGYCTGLFVILLVWFLMHKIKTKAHDTQAPTNVENV